MNKIELLAPAGSLESLYAAVQAGADAVYIGGSKFSARAYASNFDDENMIRAIDYCHLYNVRIFVTINTLMKENEIDEAIEYARFLYEQGVDALIIQDLGFAAKLKGEIPDYEIHASTQITVHNGEGAKLMVQSGFKRIVLSRELSLNEIKYISKELNIETEIFIHGALCICYSGQCLMSSLIGGRSGNRGRCAQPCRLPYTLLNKSGDTKAKGYLLSPKDICTIEDIEKIILSGTKSLKIEGRMKRPEYVAGVVSAYRKTIDSVYSKINNNFNINREKEKLAQLFNRQGFSKAYLYGNTSKDMMAMNFPKNTGVKLGTVSKGLTVLLDNSLSIKDGVRVSENGFIVSKIFKNGKQVTEANKGDRVEIKPCEFKSGDVLYKTSDTRLFEELKEIYKDVYGKKIQLDLKINFKISEPLSISTEYKNKLFTSQGHIVEKAEKSPITKDKILNQLKKSGGTPFEFLNVSLENYEPGFTAVSSLNEVRRNLISDIENYIISSYKRKIVNRNVSEKHNTIKNNEMPEFIITVNTSEQFKAAVDTGFHHIAVNIFNKKDNINLEDILNESNKIYLVIPNIIKEEFSSICSVIKKYSDKIQGIITSNLGIINVFKGKLNIIGDYKLNIFNSYSAEYFEKIINGYCISVELNRSEIIRIDPGKFNAQMLIYGRIENMVSEYCAIGGTVGEKSQTQSCKAPCTRDSFVLQDRMLQDFPIITDKYCRMHIYNSAPLNLLGNLNDIKKLNFKSYRLDFTDEDYNKTTEVLHQLKKGTWSYDFQGYTRGHYKRGVE
ncbi:U32 family peptidase [Clostridium sp. JN-9]|uniref:U32 family peptidase n=1 Tax=Clostridium sp. JN-9 TaxID=2507159 RepID=UPI000FFE2FD8|nr:U32 family peptidase [Clostridium sp. JN-9]QAT41068.1 U32 family peptidase [Clostridium sp. JN-9]